MLKSVHFKSIKALQDVRLDLSRLTFLVGPNGCGKSTLLDQIEVLCRCSQVSGRSGHVLGDAGKALAALQLNTSYTEGFSQAPMLWAGEDSEGARLSVECKAPGDVSWFTQTTLAARTHARELITTDRDSSTVQRAAFEELLTHRFSWRAQRLRLVPQAIAAPVDVRVDTLDPSGRGLAAILTGFALNDQDAYAALQADMRTIVPQFERLHITRVDVAGGDSGERHGGVALGMVLRGAGRRPAAQISDGTLLALALLTATHNRELPPLLLMDDIDHGLHLGAQLALIRAIRKVMEVRPELQVVCTTHSPYLLDAAEPDEVRVMALDADGHSVLRPLTDYPDFKRHHRGLQTGEFWATIGEQWVADAGGTHG